MIGNSEVVKLLTRNSAIIYSIYASSVPLCRTVAITLQELEDDNGACR